MGPRPSSPLKPSATRKPAHATSSGWGTRRRHRPARRLYPQAIEEIQFSVSPIGGQFWVSLDSPFSQPADDDMPSVPASGTTRLSRLTLPSDRQTTTLRAFRVRGTDCSDGATCSPWSRDLSASQRPFPRRCTCGDPTSRERRTLDGWRPDDPPARVFRRIRRPSTGSRSGLRT